MALYMVSYDIAEQDSSEYDPLWSLLVDWKAHRVQYSQWVLVAAPGSAMRLAEIITEAVPLKDKDRLLVQEVAQDAAWLNLELPDSQAVIVFAAARP
jgi:CRISPR/Cas system-associated endoribonuclease Cas2